MLLPHPCDYWAGSPLIYLCPVCILPIEFRAHGKYLSFGQWGGKSWRLLAKTDGRIRDCRTLYLGWHGPTTWFGIKFSEVWDLWLTSGQMNQLWVGWILFMSLIEVLNLWTDYVSRGMMSLWLTHFCSEIKKPAKQVSAGWRTMLIALIDGVLPSWEGVLNLDN